MLLSELKKTKEYLVCIDSDGCLLDNMELKHKECFCPAFVNIWDLQPVSRYAREVWEYVNLYSMTRGTNRFPALVRALDLVYAHPAVRERNIKKWEYETLREWTEKTDNFSESALQNYIEGLEGDPPMDLASALVWSRAVNASIRGIVRNIGPFPGVEETLAALKEHANVVVVSSTPQEALIRELKNCGVYDYFDAVAGQESGTKARCIKTAMSAGFDEDHTLKVGDAPGDYAAAQANGCLFYPIIPGAEEDSWKTLKNKAAQVFFTGHYKGTMMDERVDAFTAVLNAEPAWMHPQN